MMRRALVFAALAAGLSGCMDASGAIESAPNAGPGPALLAPETAGELFARACILTEPSFRGTATALAAYPFTQNSETGTYYHNTGNLSVKVHEGTCSLVYGTKVPVDDAVSGLARGTASVTTNLPPDINVTSSMGPDGVRYFRLGLQR